jgi:hypothetical protein
MEGKFGDLTEILVGQRVRNDYSKAASQNWNPTSVNTVPHLKNENF